MDGKRIAGFVLAPVVLVWLLLNPISGVTPEAARLAAVLAFVVVFWITEAIPLAATAILGSAMAVLFGVAGLTQVMAPYANKIIFLFLGAFIIGKALAIHGLDERIARGITRWSWIRASKQRTVIALALVGMFLSMWISNTAATIIIIPIALAALHSKKVTPMHSFAALSAAFAANIGGIATPVGTPPNLIAIGVMEQMHLPEIDFFSWMVIGVPIAVVMALFLILTKGLIFKHTQVSEQDDQADMQVTTHPWTMGEISVLVVFAVVVVLWVTPGFLKIFFGAKAPITLWFKHHLHESVVALFGAVALFILPGGKGPYRPVLTWKEAQEIDWGTLLLFGGGLSLGHLMFTTGLGKAVGHWLIVETGASTLISVTVLSVVTGKVITELVSNTATANMLVPVAYSLATALHVNPAPPMIGAALGAGLAFLLPVSTPPNAVAYGTGHIKLSQMFKWGLIMDAIALVVIIAHLILLIKLGFFA